MPVIQVQKTREHDVRIHAIEVVRDRFDLRDVQGDKVLSSSA
jgi:hypothetical protein